MCHSVFGVAIQAAVRKRIGRDVQNAHHAGALRQRPGSLSQHKGVRAPSMQAAGPFQCIRHGQQRRLTRGSRAQEGGHMLSAAPQDVYCVVAAQHVEAPPLRTLTQPSAQSSGGISGNVDQLAGERSGKPGGGAAGVQAPHAFQFIGNGCIGTQGQQARQHGGFFHKGRRLTTLPARPRGHASLA